MRHIWATRAQMARSGPTRCEPADGITKIILRAVDGAAAAHPPQRMTKPRLAQLSRVFLALGRIFAHVLKHRNRKLAKRLRLAF